ncbi:restriction endonuclease subunit S [Spirulina subsalsa FACHB-351]|uniref:Restriction endonuclease subunit S n=1 Tax=Spirulina subsalsa FACHB-351 TaxID=234711 RepID=A0ABT3L1H6_9CYAN|nr:restriction endonuclease subunit S [Spirulina subsalsa]MCW6035067.1 restriction endonuclease subunit S [Spirulina subsalsa FACHB-351]
MSRQELAGNNNQVPPGYKQTEVGVIPEDWEVVLLGDAFEIRNHLRLPISKKVRDSMQGKYPYYGPTGVQGYISEYRVEGEHALIGEDGDHFLKWRDISMTLLVNGKFNVNNHAHIIKGVNNLTTWFYYFFCHRDLTRYLKRQGAGRYKLNKSTLINIPCAVPPLPEQKAIASVLSDVDELISSLDKLIAKKRHIKTATMQQLLTGKTRLPGFGEGMGYKKSAKGMGYKKSAKGMGYKKSAIGLIPEDWEVTIIDEVTSEVGDGLHATPLYSDQGNYYFINGNNLVDSKIYVDTITQKCDQSEAKKYQQRLNQRTILLSINGTIGNLAFYQGEPVILGKSVAYLNPTKNISKNYLYYQLQTQTIKNFFRNGLTGTTIFNLGLGTIRKTPIAIPPLPEQKAIASVLSDMDKEIAALEKRRAKTQGIKQGMMQELLTGRTRLINNYNGE